jgi:transglutaminase superfamily protein
MSGVSRNRRRLLASLAALLLLAAGCAVLTATVTTRQGIDYVVTEHRIPLYAKAFEFLDRDGQYRRLAAEITRGSDSDAKRVQAVYDWTARRIQPTPEGWPIVDDHILNIIIRGYGTADQRADVFATLLTYAGVPAFWRKIKAPGLEDGVVLTFVKADGRWIVIDVANGFLFRNVRGEPAGVDDFAAKRAVVPAAASSLAVGSTPYSQILATLRMPPVPRPLRAELQMPWPRLWDQTKRAIGRRPDNGTER